MPALATHASYVHPGRSQHGLALIELLLVTVPLCILSITLSSRIFASALGKQDAARQAWLDAQLEARRCPPGPAHVSPHFIQAAQTAPGWTGSQEALQGMPSDQKAAQEFLRLPVYTADTGSFLSSGIRQWLANRALAPLVVPLTFPCNEPGSNTPTGAARQFDAPLAADISDKVSSLYPATGGDLP